jgi:hypothetical protein
MKYYYINRSRKKIVETTPYDITRSLYKLIRDKEWSTLDEIDLLSEKDINLQELRVEMWYVLESHSNSEKK